MSFLRRLFGGDDRSAEATDGGSAAAPANAGSVEEAERLHELDLARAEAERLDALQQRQLRYARHAWTPPAQGGEQRADDPASSPGEG